MKRALVLGVLAVTVALSCAAPAGATPGSPYAPQYYFDNWQVDQLWQNGALGQGITIGEIDTGVDANIATLAGRVLSGKDFGRLGGNGQIDRDEDDYGHGTSMASIMVGRAGEYGIEGLAPAAKVLPVAIPLGDTTDAASDDRLPDAIRWAADHGAKIINMSLGGSRRPSQNSTACPVDDQSAIYYALRKGVVLFASSGNQGRHGNVVEEPGVCLGVVSVGAVDSSGTVADFSSRHPYLTLSAPGVAIASFGPGGVPFSGDGTSQAAAIASAAAALVWSKYPRLTSTQLVARLLATLDDRRATRDPAYGYGTINPYRAVTSAVPTDAPDPVYALAEPFRQRAGYHPSVPVAPKPVERAAAAPGNYAVAGAPALLAHRVLAGLAAAGAGLLLVLVLVVVGWRGRRRRLAARATTEWAVISAPAPPG